MLERGSLRLHLRIRQLWIQRQVALDLRKRQVWIQRQAALEGNSCRGQVKQVTESSLVGGCDLGVHVKAQSSKLRWALPAHSFIKFHTVQNEQATLLGILLLLILLPIHPIHPSALPLLASCQCVDDYRAVLILIA